MLVVTCAELGQLTRPGTLQLTPLRVITVLIVAAERSCRLSKAGVIVACVMVGLPCIPHTSANVVVKMAVDVSATGPHVFVSFRNSTATDAPAIAPTAKLYS